MHTVSREKAEIYARYRLPYSDDAVQFVLDQIEPACRSVADIGAGTGLLTRHFAGRVTTLYAVEPEPHMRAILERDLAGVVSIGGTAEATGLPHRSVDLIVAANAYHRFDPVGALAEFGRILRPGGWLAIFSYGFRPLPGDDLATRFPQWRARQKEKYVTQSPAHFFGKAVPTPHSFPQTRSETWDEYWGAVQAGMEAPSAADDWFSAIEAAHRERFTSQAVDGILTVPYRTEVLLGQPLYE
jgi:SAM-dependent methyltransferase